MQGSSEPHYICTLPQKVPPGKLGHHFSCWFFQISSCQGPHSSQGLSWSQRSPSPLTVTIQVQVYPTLRHFPFNPHQPLLSLHCITGFIPSVLAQFYFSAFEAVTSFPLPDHASLDPMLPTEDISSTIPKMMSVQGQTHTVTLLHYFCSSVTAKSLFPLCPSVGVLEILFLQRQHLEHFLLIQNHVHKGPAERQEAKEVFGGSGSLSWSGSLFASTPF